jgi:hypothetical protein
MDEDELLDEDAPAPANNEKIIEPLNKNRAEKPPINGWFEPLIQADLNAALESESNSHASTSKSASPDLEFIKNVPESSYC